MNQKNSFMKKGNKQFNVQSMSKEITEYFFHQGVRIQVLSFDPTDKDEYDRFVEAHDKENLSTEERSKFETICCFWYSKLSTIERSKRKPIGGIVYLHRFKNADVHELFNDRYVLLMYDDELTDSLMKEITSIIKARFAFGN